MRLLSRLVPAAVAVLAAASALPHPALAQSAFDQQVEATPGLLGYYTFTAATQANSAVNGYTGVLQGNAAIGSAHQGPPVHAPAGALILDQSQGGTGDAIAGGAAPLQGMIGSAGSIIAWIRLDALASTTGHILSIAGESQEGNDLDLQINTDDCVHFYTDGGSSTVAGTCFTAADLGKWKFVAASFTANGPRNLYIGARLVGTSTAGSHGANSSPFYQGESPVFTGRYFPGRISDAALFDRALTARQIRAIYAARLGTPQ